MSGVETRRVDDEEGELRLDRWFRRHYPGLGHGRLQKLLRTGQIRVDGRRAKADERLGPGRTIRVPPLSEPDDRPPTTAPRPLTDADRAFVRGLVVHEDDALIVLDKPAGLAVQGGTGTTRHVDGLLDGLARGGGRPKLVHRLDRDTSGLLVLARTPAAAAHLTAAFRRHEVAKLYWAVVVGRPKVPAGTIDRPLAKVPGPRGEVVADDEEGRRARTRYRVVQAAGRAFAWLAMLPLTGRTHQLRVHAASALGTPILGDGKYGGATARPNGAPAGLMLHARELALPHPNGGVLRLRAPPPAHLLDAFAWLGFSWKDADAADLDALGEG